MLIFLLCHQIIEDRIQFSSIKRGRHFFLSFFHSNPWLLQFVPLRAALDEGHSDQLFTHHPDAIQENKFLLSEPVSGKCISHHPLPSLRPLWLSLMTQTNVLIMSFSRARRINHHFVIFLPLKVRSSFSSSKPAAKMDAQWGEWPVDWSARFNDFVEWSTTETAEAIAAKVSRDCTAWTSQSPIGQHLR